MAAAVVMACASLSAVRHAASSARSPRRACFAAPALQGRRSALVVRAASQPEGDKQKVVAIEESLKKSGINKDNAKRVLDAWRKAVGSDDITPEMLRKVLLKQSARTSGLILIQVALDLGAAYGAQTVGNLCGAAAPEYGLPAVLLQAVAYFTAGWYYTGALFDFFKIGAVVVAAQSFNVNSGAFLAAVQDLAGSSTGLSAVDKVAEAVNTFKVLQALSKMSELLKAEGQALDGKMDMLKDLAAYLTLERAQRNYNFDSAKYGISDKQAAGIATVFAAVDTNDDGVLSGDEFKRLCTKYVPDLNEAEVRAALALLDMDGDGQIQFNEFVAWWVQKPVGSVSPADSSY